MPGRKALLAPGLAVLSLAALVLLPVVVEGVGPALAAGLVVLALAAGIVVIRLERRVRHLSDRIHRRADAERALRELAQTLGAVPNIQAALEQVAESGVQTTRAFGAYIERVESPQGDVEVVAAAGPGTPPVGTRVPYPGSLTEAMIEAGEPEMLTEIGAVGERMAPYLAESCSGCSGLIAPLLSGSDVLGALVLLRNPEQPRFEPDEVALARAVGGLASAALRRVLLLNEARESEQRFRALAENAADAIITIDQDDRILFVNPATERIFGYPRDELLRMPFTELMPERLREWHRAGMHRYLTTGERHLPWDGVELPGLTREGEEIPLEATFSEFVQHGRHFFTGIMRDISSRKRDETERERLLASESRSRAAAEAAERRMRFLYEAGRTLTSSLGYEETLRKVAQAAVPALADWAVVDTVDEAGEIRRAEVVAADPDKRELAEALRRRPRDSAAEQGVPRVIRTGEPELAHEVSDEWLQAAAGGQAEIVRLARALGIRSTLIVPLVARGRTLGAITLVGDERRRPYDDADVDHARDLADRAALAIDNAQLFETAQWARNEAERRAREEAALRRAAQTLTATFTVHEIIHRIANSAVTATGARGAFVERICRGADELEIAAAAGEYVPELGVRFPYQGSVAERVIRRTEPELIDDPAGSAGFRVPGLARTCPRCSALVVPLLDAGEAIGVLVLLRSPEEGEFHRDEIERAHAFANLAALAFRKVHLLEDSESKRKELQQLTESRARLMRGFSHDVKNPLGAADGRLQLLEEGIVDGLSDEQLENVRKVRSSIGSALDLIDDLVELARAETGRIELEHMPVDMREIAREIAEEYRPEVEGKGLGLELALPAEFPIISTDPDRIRQILGNLVSNAVKYTEEGGIRVVVGTREAGPEVGPGPWLAMAVSDTGPGIPEEEQRLLFEEFSRVQPDGKPGAGLGLAISQRIAHALDGELTLESEPGKGSTFTLWLPPSDAAAAGPPAAEPRPEGARRRA